MRWRFRSERIRGKRLFATRCTLLDLSNSHSRMSLLLFVEKKTISFLLIIIELFSKFKSFFICLLILYEIIYLHFLLIW